MSEETKLLPPGENLQDEAQEPSSQSAPQSTDDVLDELLGKPKQDYSDSYDHSSSTAQEQAQQDAEPEAEEDKKAEYEKAAKAWIETIDTLVGLGLNFYAGDDDLSQYRASKKAREEARDSLIDVFEEMEGEPLRIPFWLSLLIVMAATYVPLFQKARRVRKKKEAEQVAEARRKQQQKAENEGVIIMDRYGQQVQRPEPQEDDDTCPICLRPKAPDKKTCASKSCAGKYTQLQRKKQAA